MALTLYIDQWRQVGDDDDSVSMNIGEAGLDFMPTILDEHGIEPLEGEEPGYYRLDGFSIESDTVISTDNGRRFRITIQEVVG